MDKYLTQEDLDQLYRNGGDGWKTAETITNELKEYDNNVNFFMQYGFTREVAKKVLICSLLTVWDIYALFKEVSALPENSVYLEIGSYSGGSVICAYMAALLQRKNLTIVAIDPFFDDAHHREIGIPLERVYEENTKHIPHILKKQCSDEASDTIPDNSIDLLFIDANHSYEFVKKDIQLYWSKLKMRGTMLCHDFSPIHYDVVRAFVETVRLKEFTKGKGTSIVKVVKEVGYETL